MKHIGMKHSYYLIPLAVFSIVLLIGLDAQKAFAYTITNHALAGGVPSEGIVRVDDNIFVATGPTNSVLRFDSADTDFTTGIDSVVCTGCQTLFTYQGRVYSFGTTVLYEIDVTVGGVMVVTRTVTASDCETGENVLQDNINTANGEVVCIGGTNNNYEVYDLDTMTLVFDSGSLANKNCRQPTNVVYNVAGNFIVLACNGSGGSPSTQQSITVLTHKTTTRLSHVNVTGVADMFYDEDSDKLFASRSTTGAMQEYDLSISGNDLTFVEAVSACGNIISGDYDLINNRFFTLNTAGEICNWDSTDGDQLNRITIHTIAGLASQIYRFDSTKYYVAYGDSAETIGIFNPIGLDSGSGAPPETGDPNIIGGIDCSLPANANILICRLGGDNNFGGIGNSTGTGLLNLGCNVIFVDCTDTNPQTNGLGLLAFIASLFVIIGMFYYAIGKEAFHMPLFIWIVIVIALSAFFTIAGWIDPIFLILAIVAIIAMAVPKIVNITKGSSTMGSDSTA